MGRRAADLVHALDRAAVMGSPRNADADGRLTCDARFYSAAGGHRWLSVTARPVLDSAGGKAGCSGGARDIQPEVEAHQALRASEERYRLLAENSSDVVLMVDPADTYLWASQSVAGATGWQPEHLVGRRASDFIHPEDLCGLRNAARLGKGGQEEADYRLRCADGSYAGCRSGPGSSATPTAS